MKGMNSFAINFSVNYFSYSVGKEEFKAFCCARSFVLVLSLPPGSVEWVIRSKRFMLIFQIIKQSNFFPFPLPRRPPLPCRLILHSHQLTTQKAHITVEKCDTLIIPSPIHTPKYSSTLLTQVTLTQNSFHSHSWWKSPRFWLNFINMRVEREKLFEDLWKTKQRVSEASNNNLIKRQIKRWNRSGGGNVTQCVAFSLSLSPTFR